MSLVFFCDLHLSNWKSFSTVLENGLNSRLIDQMKVVGLIADALRPDDTVIFGGDLIDSYSESLPKVIYSAAFAAVKAWAEKCDHLYIIIGNHDIYRDQSIIETFGEIDNVSIVSKKATINYHGWAVDMVPWNDTIPTQQGDILFAHLMPIGAWMGKLVGKRADEGVDIKQVSDYIYPIFAHVHEPQSIVIPGDPDAGMVLCPGSIMQLNLSSSDAPRYLYRLENELTKIKIPSPKIRTKVINTQKELEEFLASKSPKDYYKLIATDGAINFPPFDHTVLVEYETKPMAGEKQIEDVKEIDLLEVMSDFIDNSKTSIDKIIAKEVIRRIYE